MNPQLDVATGLNEQSRFEGRAEHYASTLALGLKFGLVIFLVGTLAGCAASPLKAPCGPLNGAAVTAYDSPENDPCGEAKPVNAAFSFVITR